MHRYYLKKLLYCSSQKYIYIFCTFKTVWNNPLKLHSLSKVSCPTTPHVTSNQWYAEKIKKEINIHSCNFYNSLELYTRHIKRPNLTDFHDDSKYYTYICSYIFLEEMLGGQQGRLRVSLKTQMWGISLFFSRMNKKTRGTFIVPWAQYCHYS